MRNILKHKTVKGKIWESRLSYKKGEMKNEIAGKVRENSGKIERAARRRLFDTTVEKSWDETEHGFL